MFDTGNHEIHVFPGDQFVWIYTFRKSLVTHDEETWSAIMQKQIPLYGISTLISCLYNDTITWLSNSGNLYTINMTSVAPWYTPVRRQDVIKLFREIP